jgi:hypothetical protein
VGSGFSRTAPLVEDALPGQATSAGHPISDVMARLSTYMSQARDRLATLLAETS